MRKKTPVGLLSRPFYNLFGCSSDLFVEAHVEYHFLQILLFLILLFPLTLASVRTPLSRFFSNLVY